jgi:hypothetical protein
MRLTNDNCRAGSASATCLGGLGSQFTRKAVVSDSDFISGPRFLDFMKRWFQKSAALSSYLYTLQNTYLEN